jgi:hypothetical protein
MALALAAAVFGLFVYNTRAPKDAIVPGIRGMTKAEAKRTLQSRGLAMRVVKEMFDEKVPPGTVLLVNPPDGSQVKQGKLIDVWLSKGPEPAVVPSVLELPEEDAKNRIHDANLTVGPVRSQYDETVPKGMVITQDPPASTEVRRKSAVSLVVSRGPEPLPPPEPDTPPETVPPPTSTDTTSPEAGSTDTSTDGGTLTVPLGGETSTDSSATTEAPPDKHRDFDINTKLEGTRGWARLRIMLTDDSGRREIVNELYRKGQTVHNRIKAEGDPGTVRIEVYENRKLVKDQQF